MTPELAFTLVVGSFLAGLLISATLRLIKGRG